MIRNESAASVTGSIQQVITPANDHLSSQSLFIFVCHRKSYSSGYRIDDEKNSWTKLPVTSLAAAVIKQFFFNRPTWFSLTRVVHKIAFELGPITVHWYGVLLAAGFLAGIWTASRRGLRDGIPAETIV